jgi:PAS domain S-box-containing protein/putative nucleotidyltransferase with HDIG domain
MEKIMSYHVLIADDQEPIRKLVKRTCLELGWTVDQAASGYEALDLMKVRPHQVFILDVKMPGPSGIELAREIMKYEDSPAILIMTGYAEVGDAVQAIKEGIYNYIQKDNVDPADLRCILKQAAEYHDACIRSQEADRERGETVENIEAVNKQFRSLLELSADLILLFDVRMNRFADCNAAACEQLEYSREELLSLSLCDIDIDLTETGWIDMVQAVRTQNSYMIERIFHKAKGEMLTVELSLAYVALKSGEYISIVGRNITERKLVEEERKTLTQKLHNSLMQTIQTVSLALEKRDPYTAGHQQRVTQFALAIAKEMHAPNEEIDGLRLGGLVHDIGKIYIPSEILTRPGKLTDIEFMLIKTHAQVGYDILKEVDFPWPIAQMVLQHHERLNGSGYPQGLKGDEILPEAKILAVADVVEAMASHRPYRSALGMDKAVDEIKKHQGVFYDPKAVDACCKIIENHSFDFDA